MADQLSQAATWTIPIKIPVLAGARCAHCTLLNRSFIRPVITPQTTKNKRPGLSTGPFALFDAWQFPTLAWGDPTLPSALRRFTSEFGMG
ncbi:hypothetical protein AAHA48_00005, partial [Dickeya oryzae]